MKNKLKRNLSQTQILPDFFNLEKNDEDRFLNKLIYFIKENKNNSKNFRQRNNKNNINNHYKSNTINYKNIIKKSLESNINLSKEYNNFCGSFLYPDYYSFAPGKKILKDLKSNGVEKTIFKHFFKNIPKTNYIKKSNIYSVIRNKKNSTRKSKYLGFINNKNSNNNRIYKNNNIIKINNDIIPEQKKKVIIFEYNIKKGKAKENDDKENNFNNCLINENFKYSFSKSKSYLNSSNSYNSKKMKNIGMFNIN